MWLHLSLQLLRHMPPVCSSMRAETTSTQLTVTTSKPNKVVHATLTSASRASERPLCIVHLYIRHLFDSHISEHFRRRETLVGILGPTQSGEEEAQTCCACYAFSARLQAENLHVSLDCCIAHHICIRQHAGHGRVDPDVDLANKHASCST